VQDVLKRLVKGYLPSEAPGITTEGMFQKVMTKSGETREWSNPDSLRVHIRTILKNMHDLGEVRREAAVGDHGGSTFVYTLSRSSQAESFPPTYTPSMRSSSTARTNDHEHFTQNVDGSPMGLSHLLWRPDERTQLGAPDAEAHETPDNDDVIQDISQLDSSNQSSAGPERAITITDGPGSKLPQEHDGPGVGEEDSDKADISYMELLKSARALRVELGLTMNDISTLELQKQEILNQCLILERQANEQSLKESELLASARRMREETLKAEGQAAECREGTDRLRKEADDKRNSQKESETTIAATEKKAAEIEESLQRIRDELKI
jgi:hypothetical protein